MHEPQPVGDTTPFILEAIVADLRNDATYAKMGHTARTLLRASDLRLVLVAIKSGGRMNEHETQETALLHTLSGDVRVDLPDRSLDLGPGQIVAIERGVRHTVEARRDSAFLLTLGWPAQVDDE
jgi:quercetin dioxygenase-like cupin family protein